MKELFAKLTKQEYQTLKSHCLALGMHERTFYELKKKKEITASFMNILFDACKINYDYRTGNINREQP